MASGVLNMSRGMGTALGLAVTGTIFVVAGGEQGAAGASGAQHAFTVTAYVLAAVAAAAGVVSALRANGTLVERHDCPPSNSSTTFATARRTVHSLMAQTTTPVASALGAAGVAGLSDEELF